MVDQVASTQKLHKILLAWNYFDLCNKVEEGGGVFDELSVVPDKFRDLQVCTAAHKLIHETAAHIDPHATMRRLLLPSGTAVARPGMACLSASQSPWFSLALRHRPGSSID